MQSCNDALQALDAALKTVLPDVYHFEAYKQEGKYIVWAEDGQAGDATEADNTPLVQSISGTVDFYTKDEFDSTVQRIQAVMSGTGIYWYLNSIQYEDTTGYIHYEWAFEIGVDPHGEDGV